MKNNTKLTYVKKNNNHSLFEYKNKYYSCNDVCAELGCSESDLKYASKADILYLIENELVRPKGIIYEGIKYDWRHIDPVTGLPKVQQPRPEDKIETMGRMPGHSCWIYLLQNRVNLNSMGNRYYKRKVWFDTFDKSVSTDKSKDDATYFRQARLSDGSYAQGWMFAEDMPANLR